MQTFLPYMDFGASARELDNARLGKQRIEGIAILRSLIWKDDATRHHPACHQWRGYESHLVRYINEMRKEWMRRGYTDTLGDEMLILEASANLGRHYDQLPPWLGYYPYHNNHVARLFAKDPVHYAGFAPLIGSELNQTANLWPITARGSWEYMMDGKVVATIEGARQPYRLVGWRKDWRQCHHCRHWVNLTDCDDRGVCIICVPFDEMYTAEEALRGMARGMDNGGMEYRRVADGLQNDILALVRAARAGLPTA